MNKKAKALLKKNNELEKQLTPEAIALMTDIIVYIRGANISDFHQESVRYDILQMVLEGEKRGDTIQDIIGEDPQTFCDEVLREVPHLTVCEHLLTLISLSCLSLGILMVMWLVYMMLNALKGHFALPYIPVTDGQIVSAILILLAATSLFQYVSKTSFDQHALKSKMLFVLFFLITFVSLMLNTYMTTTLISLHVYVIIGIILLLFLIYRVIDIKI